MKQLGRGLGLLGRPPVYPPTPTPQAPTPPPVAPQGAGIARALPFLRGKAAETIPVTAQVSVQATANIMSLANLSIPKMRDIARFESSLISRDVTRQQEVNRVQSTLQHIANPNLVTLPLERERVSSVRDKLVQQKQKGDPLATQVLSASTLVAEKQAVVRGVPTEVPAKAPVTARVPVGAKPITTLATMSLPVVNKVQQVSLEEYEEVKKMWQGNYATLEPPKSLEGREVSRREWIKTDVEKVNQAINLLTSADPQLNRQGMEMVANILPFLLIGGFSRTEVIAYLKAKLEGAKSVLSDIEKKEEEEETLVERESRKEEKSHEMAAEAQKIEEKKPPQEEVKETVESPVSSAMDQAKDTTGEESNTKS